MVGARLLSPLRESAQRELLESHLAEGNWSEGWRTYEPYRRLLGREVGVEPHPTLASLLDARPGERLVTTATTR